MKKFWIRYQKSIVDGAIILSCLSLFTFFPYQENDLFQELITSVVFLFLVPFLYIKIILKSGLKKYGLSFGDWKKGIVAIPIGWVFSFLFLYFFYHYTDFRDAYFLPETARNNFWFFILYELIVVNLFLLLYEFFFRGFIYFSFRFLGSFWPAIIQFIIFALWALLLGMLFETVPFLIVSLVSGFIVYYSRSIIYSYGFALIFILIMDAILIKI